jgi:hypothetical protein
LDTKVRDVLVGSPVTGDDWTVAAAIGAALLATWGLVQAGVSA